MSTVVVTGAAGSLGRRVAALLSARPDVDRVVGIDITPRDGAAGPGPDKLENLAIDLASPPARPDSELEKAMVGASAVLHLAWKASDGRGANAGNESSAATTNRRSLARVLAACAAAGVEQFVHLSSATVYGAWPDNKIPLTEDARLRPNPEFSFAVSKAESERVVAEWSATQPEVKVAILRPTVTVASDERPLYRALGVTRSPASGDGARPVQYLHVEDLARAVVQAWERGLEGVYNVAPDAGIPESEARALAGGVAKVALPARVAEAVSAWSWQVWRQGTPVEARAYTTHSWVVAPDRLKAAGWKPEYSSAEALVATDDRLHWDDLPPGRRQNYNLVITLAAVAGLVGAAGGLVAAIRARGKRKTA